MKKAILVLLLTTFFYSAQSRQTINALLNDISYLERFGVMPDNTCSENQRISTHLAYVENLLRLKNSSTLSSRQLANRNKILDLLHQYWTAGIYPANYSYPGERKPCFIDKKGNICAVGYLVEQTAGRNISEFINTQNQYKLIYEMNADIVALLLAWCEENGLTLEECAMIQPMYGPMPEPRYVKGNIGTDYWVSSGMLGGVNVGLAAWNLSGKANSNKNIQYLGLFTGTTQLMVGILNIKKDKTYYEINGGSVTTDYSANNNLSFFNIASGTSAILTSALNLARKKKNKENHDNITLFANPDTKSLYVGFSLTKRI